MAEDPQPLTLQQRIAALNAAHIGRIPGDLPRSMSKPTPPIPSRPALPKQHSINNPPEKITGSVADVTGGNQPAPPPPTRKQPPPLPCRTGSIDDQRRGSATSISSGTADTAAPRATATRTKSTESTSRIKAPAWGECALPVLPPKGTTIQPASRRSSEDRPKYVNRAPSVTSVATVNEHAVSMPCPGSKPSLPPRLPARKVDIEHREQVVTVPIRSLPPMPTANSIENAKKAAFSYAAGRERGQGDGVSPTDSSLVPASKDWVSQKVQNNVPQVMKGAVAHVPKPNLPSTMMDGLREHKANLPIPTPVGPPPVPLSSRPDLSALQATKPKVVPATATATGTTLSSPLTLSCLVCRDFSGPDLHATRFPRAQVSSLPTLAQQLTAPFASPTDKARAIFTWLHHNVSYDVVSFFGNNVKSSTPQSTLQSGLAVCEGYAALFTNLATHAGLESVTISGHGKGYGFTPLPSGAPLPPYNAGHAWNAVKVDEGEWKLIDTCWGAGYVQGAGRPYVAKFNPDYFTMSNEQFAVKHFPSNKDLFFLPGGRLMSWEEYIVIDPSCWPDLTEGPTIFTNAKEDYSIGEKTVYPRARQVNLRQGGVVRFQFGLLCPHWTLDRHTRKGLPPVFIMSINGVDGRNKDHIPMDHHGSSGNGGDTWVADIPAHDLGAPGQTVTLFAVTSFGGRQDARGLTVREFRDGKGRVGMGFVGVAAWELV